ncbi:Deoxyribodipyrimidine photo-lyase type II [Tindallia magadiensis]|uniref:Deoxyribodipyrimidine photo-lyase n=1 Tax=Tindallia magadiensis TaxID=69895 RepID=A0A1I3B2U9_9FIRM|nr:deoxyribodipyrimidine photo-lyase [Tindallia magadiensis]SFH56416.1 Deoxyribodipyrimidine photo-lyase type II [Tindallia magadiensis]
MNLKRVRLYKKSDQQPGPVIYWMSRDQRVHDHWGLIFAQKLAKQYRAPLCVVFSMVPDFLDATLRQYDFMLKGLEEIEETLSQHNISFFLLLGAAPETLPAFIDEHHISALVTDFSPLKIHRSWLRDLKEKISIPIYQVDSHNIIPCWEVSTKQEYAAYTLRPKIKKRLPEFLEPFPELMVHPFSWPAKITFTNWTNIRNALDVDPQVPPVDWLVPGETAGKAMLNHFIESRLSRYHSHRNDPLGNAVSNLSPYFHFGHISPQRAALAVSQQENHPSSKESFLEELIVRRELSDNFCYYNTDYDNDHSFPNWAKASLSAHINDEREYLYSLQEFENANTHDELWNACQRNIMIAGKLHGYLRMYWAKKILEWSPTPKLAQQHAIYLNDKYCLDGRDPNGYAGIAWSIGGIHDRAWFERPVFGKVRYMNQNGCKRKFDVDAYIHQINTNLE